jgi:hypothetical protein
VRGEFKDPFDVKRVLPSTRDNVPESEHPDFSAFMVSPRCWKEVGEFDEAIAPAYHEDVELHIRMMVVGIKAINVPMALYYHYGSKTHNEALGAGKVVTTNAAFERNRDYVMAKWGTLAAERLNYRHPFNDPTKTIKWTKQNPV